MEIERKTAWLSPERILKLYDGHKDAFGSNRLFVIGIGRNGVDCLLRCKHLTERRFGTDDKAVRFFAIGEDRLLENAACEGTGLAPSECLPIVPEEAIYKYLNSPARLPQYALDWFDTGLKNYSPATPTYGLTKRQCGRVALFHCIKQLLKRLGEAIAAFAGTSDSLEIVITGNMGDVFFGGMFIDMAYILHSLFEDASYPVKINASLFAADTAALFEEDQRELGNYYANTMITRNELDLFQYHKKPFSQRYSASFEVKSDKAPFNSVQILPALASYALTVDTAAEKILSRAEMVFGRDDDAERIMSYNMLKPHEPHDFRWLTYGVSVREVPMGKIVSYLSVRVFTLLNRRLNANSVGQMQLGQFGSRVTPDGMLLASKAGALPELEFDERLNPTFSPRALKISSDGSQGYVDDWAQKMSDLTKKGAEVCGKEIVDEIISTCEAAKTDMEKGPFYAIEIVKKCLADLRVAIAKENSEYSDMEEQVERARSLVSGAYMKVKTSALFVGKAVEQYIFELRDYAEYSRRLKTSATMREFYRQEYDTLGDYLEGTLAKAAEAFENIAMNRASIIEQISRENEDECARDAFSVSDPAVSAKLDELVEKLPDEVLSRAFKASGMLEIPDDDESGLARAMVNIVAKCFNTLLSMNFSEICAFFGVGGIAPSLEECLSGVSTAAPAQDDFTLDRVICPKYTRQDEIAALRASHKGMNYIWNGSTLGRAAVVTQIKGGVQLEGFRDYQQWENMHYAYINDSLKKHGIHIFTQ